MGPPVVGLPETVEWKSTRVIARERRPDDGLVGAIPAFHEPHRGAPLRDAILPGVTSVRSPAAGPAPFGRTVRPAQGDERGRLNCI